MANFYLCHMGKATAIEVVIFNGTIGIQQPFSSDIHRFSRALLLKKTFFSYFIIQIGFEMEFLRLLPVA